VRQLRAAAVAGVIHEGEVIFEADAGADGHDGLKNPRQDRAVGVVLAWIIRVEKGPPIEEEPAGSVPSADNRDRIGGVAPLRPHAPPQAPQSCADSCGLFMLVEPWPNVSTKRANPEVRPVSRSTRSAMSVISSRV